MALLIYLRYINWNGLRSLFDGHVQPVQRNIHLVDSSCFPRIGNVIIWRNRLDGHIWSWPHDDSRLLSLVFARNPNGLAAPPLGVATNRCVFMYEILSQFWVIKLVCYNTMRFRIEACRQRPMIGKGNWLSRAVRTCYEGGQLLLHLLGKTVSCIQL